MFPVSSNTSGKNPGPLVSIVIPVYNGMPFIRKTMESVWRQTYQHWELLICDNQSNDGTLACVRQYIQEKNDPRMRLIEHEILLSMAQNWNRSLGYVKGELIKVLPADDVLFPQCVEIQVHILQMHLDVGFVTSGKEVIDQMDRKLFRWKSLGEGVYDWKSVGAKSLYAVTNILGEPGGILFRKSLLNNCGDYNPDLKYFVDLELLLRFLKVSKVYVWGKPLYQFRIHGNSASASSRRIAMVEYFMVLEKYEDDFHLLRSRWFKYYLRIKSRIIVHMRSLVFWVYAQ